jgi:hypothetical protein
VPSTTHNTAPPPPPYGSLDRGIRTAVRTLFENGIETFESCEGGMGHAFYEPTVRFHGGPGEGFRAFAGLGLGPGTRATACAAGGNDCNGTNNPQRATIRYRMAPIGCVKRAVGTMLAIRKPIAGESGCAVSSSATAAGGIDRVRCRAYSRPDQPDCTHQPRRNP